MEPRTGGPEIMAGVLVAMLVGRDKVSAAFGEKLAQASIDRCTKAMTRVALAGKGRLARTLGDEMIFVFEAADDAALAAIDMQSALSDAPVAANAQIWARIGVCFASFEERDVSGEAARLAAQLSQAASNAQILTTRDTVLMLSAINKVMSRIKPAIKLDSDAQAIKVYELIWQDIIEGPGTTLV